MSRSDLITAEAYEWAEIFADAHRGVEDDRQLLALAFMELQQKQRPVLGLTHQQSAALEFITSYQATYGAAPAYAEIRDALGLASKSGVHRIVHSLIERGALTMLPGRWRSLSVRRAA